MNIYEALNKIPAYRQYYFKYKHDLYFRGDEKPANDEEFMDRLKRLWNRSTLDGFIRWERTEEYQNLLVLLMETRLIDDVHKAYEAVSAKAKEGDERAVKTMLELGKEIKSLAKTARSRMNEKVNKKKDEDVEDDLDLDLS